ncbi:AraC family transcriptional regulator [Priestia endophytica]|uniref:AraC family transcriptional regulator n=1 Tax=Priestia endophytica TaxID=135735 RepID=UPI002E245B78|nr:AraC family transcriptional regulator [Priestia endophytica]
MVRNISLNKEKIEYLCKLIFNIKNISILYINEKNKIEVEFSSHYITNPLHSDKKSLLNQLLTYSENVSLPVLQHTNYLENYIIVPVSDKNYKLGTILIGPVLFGELREEIVIGMMKDDRLSTGKKDELLYYYECIPIVDKMKFIHVGALIYYFIYGREIDVTEIIKRGLAEDQPSLHMEPQLDSALAKRRQSILVHHDLMVEKMFFQCIKEGNKEALADMLENYEYIFKGEGVLAKNSHLRSLKNTVICLIAAATRSAIDGGLNPEVALTLSDLYIQQIEEVKESKEVIAIRNKSMYDLAEKVYMSRKKGYSKPINLCLSYIFNHIYDNPTLNQLAEKSELHPNYLSKVFKKEVGKSISQYIQEQRIEEAKKLLQFSTHTISEISALLNFHDQSYFTSIFKKIVNMTPKQYRNQY